MIMLMNIIDWFTKSNKCQESKKPMGSWFAILQKKCTSQARGLGFALWSNRFLSWVNMVPRKPNIPLQDRRMDPVLDQSRRFDGKVRALSRSSFPTASRAAICRSNFGAFHRNERWLAQHSKAMKNSWKLSRLRQLMHWLATGATVAAAGIKSRSFRKKPSDQNWSCWGTDHDFWFANYIWKLLKICGV